MDMRAQQQILCEYMTFPKLDQAMILETEKNHQPLRVQGIFQRVGARNQNGRIYPDEVLRREVDKYIETYIKQNRAFGELDHPETSVVNLKNVSHKITELHWNGDDLIGTIEIIPTPNGNILRELLKIGNLGISSRGIGTLKKIDETSAMVGDDFELISFDCISNPSTQGAFLTTLTEGIIYHNIIANKWQSTERLISEILELV